MALDADVGYALNSQQMRALIQEGRLSSKLDESRIQPASFDPIIGDEVFILDTEEGLFRPTKNKTVYRSLLELPARKRPKRSIINGYEIKTGHSCLFPLEERLTLTLEERLKNSPKSSDGRIFLNSRLLTDYNDALDELVPQFVPKDPYQLWILVQPLTFNCICVSWA